MAHVSFGCRSFVSFLLLPSFLVVVLCDTVWVGAWILPTTYLHSPCTTRAFFSSSSLFSSSSSTLYLHPTVSQGSIPRIRKPKTPPVRRISDGDNDSHFGSAGSGRSGSRLMDGAGGGTAKGGRSDDRNKTKTARPPPLSSSSR